MPALASALPKPAPAKPYTKITLFEPIPHEAPTKLVEPASLDALAAELGFTSVPSFPTTASARAAFRTAAGKPLTPHAWKVYDFLIGIPPGKVVTYGELAKGIGSSPRAVGGALRSNPFAPYVPCHRVIASTLFVGGFQGDWKAVGAGDKVEGVKQNKKLTLLKSEGVEFDSKGCLIGGDSALWGRR